MVLVIKILVRVLDKMSLVVNFAREAAEINCLWTLQLHFIGFCYHNSNVTLSDYSMNITSEFSKMTEKFVVSRKYKLLHNPSVQLLTKTTSASTDFNSHATATKPQAALAIPITNTIL